jgi:hypothetical protein
MGLWNWKRPKIEAAKDFYDGIKPQNNYLVPQTETFNKTGKPGPNCHLAPLSVEAFYIEKRMRFR